MIHFYGPSDVADNAASAPRLALGKIHRFRAAPVEHYSLETGRICETLPSTMTACFYSQTLDARDAEQAIAQVMDEFDKTDVGLDSDTLANEELSMDRLPVMRESFAFLSIVGSQ